MNGCTLSADGTKVQCKKEIFIEDFKVILKNFYVRMDTVDVILKGSKQSSLYWSQQSKLKAEEKLKLEAEQNSAIPKKVKKLKMNVTKRINAKKSKTKVVNKSDLNKKIVDDIQKNEKQKLLIKI